MRENRAHSLSDLVGYDGIRSWIDINLLKIKHYLDLVLRSRDSWRLEAYPNNMHLKKEYDAETSLITNYKIDPNRRNERINQPVIMRNYSWKDRIELLVDSIKKDNFKRLEFMVEAYKVEAILSKRPGLENFVPFIKKLVNNKGYPEPADNLIGVLFAN